MGEEELAGKDEYMSSAMVAIKKATIDKLRKDNVSLKEELYLENKFSITPLDTSASGRIAAMQDEADVLTRKIQIEQRKVALADLEVKQLSAELQQHLDVIKVAGGINSATDKAIALQKEIKRYESRRQQASIKYNEAFTHCQKLRNQIDSLRRERLVFDGIYTKLEKELQEKKKAMAKMIDVTNKTYERREKCLAEVAALKAQADKEQAQFEAEWRKLGSLIDQDKRNRELVRQREMEERDRRTQELLKNREEVFQGKGGTGTKERKRSKYKSDEVESMDKVQLLGEAFQKIQMATGIHDIDELIEMFKAADDRNYTLFTYVNELNQEVAKLEDQVKAIHTEIDSVQLQDAARENERQQVQQEMEERLRNNEELAELYQKRFENAGQTVGVLKNAVHSMFQKLGCSTPAVRELLGDSGVTDQNILQHVSVIEQRVNEILRAYSGNLARSGADGEHLKVPLGQAALPVDRSRVMIAPPSTLDDDGWEGSGEVAEGEEDAEPKPLAQEQLAARVQHAVRKKAATAIFRVPEHAKRGKASTSRQSHSRG